MAYFISDTVFDQALNYLKNNVDKIVVLSADPAGSYSDATTANGTGSGKNICTVSVTTTDFTVDTAEAGGGADGKRCTAAAKNDQAVTTAGDATHVAWLDDGNTEVLFVTQLTTNRTGLTTSDTLDIPAHFAAIRDAVVAS
jgi:hypothetical protein